MSASATTTMAGGRIEPEVRPGGFGHRDRRVLLWVVAATVCWRWLLAVRAPLPGEDAVLDLWAARALADFDFAALEHVWSGPWWSALLAPGVTLGYQPFSCAMVLGAILTGLALVPAAVAVQRRADSAGVSLALLMAGAPQPAIATAGGAATPIQLLMAGLALLCVSMRRWLLGVILLGVALLDASRAGAAGVLPIGMLGIAAVAALALARLHMRVRDLLLTVAVGAMFYLAWAGSEPPRVVVERHLGEFLAERLAADEVIATDLPRVLYFAGRRPQVLAIDELRPLLENATTGAAVLRRPTARQLRPELAARFLRFQLSQRFADLVAGHGVVVLLPR